MKMHPQRLVKHTRMDGDNDDAGEGAYVLNLSGPYKYRINNSGGFNREYGIYNTWFSKNDCVDREFVLYAVWEPRLWKKSPAEERE